MLGAQALIPAKPEDPKIRSVKVSLPGRSEVEEVLVHETKGPIINTATGGTSFLLWKDCPFGENMQKDHPDNRKPWTMRSHNEQSIMISIAAKTNLAMRELREVNVQLDPELPDFLGGSKPVWKDWCTRHGKPTTTQADDLVAKFRAPLSA
mmetsp:Transcript_42486/g.98454  ORF Transcript_42486/g.98454 Transcript_42486/m.98454 type:complete len:151 (+) Transcript_42486:46-498(+)